MNRSELQEWLWFKVGWYLRQWRWEFDCRRGKHRFRPVYAVQSHWAGFQVCTVCMKAGHDPYGLGREKWPGAPGVPE